VSAVVSDDEHPDSKSAAGNDKEKRPILVAGELFPGSVPSLPVVTTRVVSSKIEIPSVGNPKANRK
jgi:hypothetical protein